MDDKDKMQKNRLKNLHDLFFTLTFVGLASLSYFQFDRAINDLSEHAIKVTAETSHKDMVRILSNASFENFERIITKYNSQKSDIDWGDFSQTLEFKIMDQGIQNFLGSSNVIRVKIFAMDGVTVYSTELEQLGEDRSENSEVIHAQRGRAASIYEYRESFAALSGTLRDIHIVSSYHPISDAVGGIWGVVEVYSNRENEVQATKRSAISYSVQYIILLSLMFSVWLILVIFRFSQTRSSDF